MRERNSALTTELHSLQSSEEVLREDRGESIVYMEQTQVIEPGSAPPRYVFEAGPVARYRDGFFLGGEVRAGVNIWGPVYAWGGVTGYELEWKGLEPRIGIQGRW